MAETLTLVELGRRLEAAGYQCSEHPAFGGVTAGAHAKNSWHYRASGDRVGAIDVNVPPPGDHAHEREMLEALWRRLVRGRDTIEQVIYRGRGYFGGHKGSKWGSYGHQTHLHVAASGLISIGGIPSASGTPSPPRSGLLRLDATGPEVGAWQRELLKHDADALGGSAVDHDFGPRTEKATKELQRHLGVADDGIVGPATRTALEEHLQQSGHPHNGPEAPPAARDRRAAADSVIRTFPTIRQQDRGLFAAAAQGALHALGFDPGEVDGIFGRGTQAAVERFQAARGITVDGVVGPVSWQALDTAINDPEPAAPTEDEPSPPATPTTEPGDGEQSLSDAGVAFIAGFEGFRGELYNDAAGHCTIGYGHLVHHGAIDGSEPDEFKRGITEARARELLRDDAATAAAAVRRLVAVPLDQGQFDALASFTFNLGAGNLAESTLRKKLNKGRYDAVPSELARWNKAGGKVLAGLTRRREAEGRLFSHGTYE